MLLREPLGKTQTGLCSSFGFLRVSEIDRMGSKDDDAGFIFVESVGRWLSFVARRDRQLAVLGRTCLIREALGRCLDYYQLSGFQSFGRRYVGGFSFLPCLR